MKRKNQTEHDIMVRDAVDFLKSKKFWDIKAALSGFKQPDKITWTATGKGHIPDVTARNGKFSLFEVETDDSINHDHTADQWGLFAAYANQYSAEFWVVVPNGSAPKAHARLAQLGIKAKVWEL